MVHGGLIHADVEALFNPYIGPNRKIGCEEAFDHSICSRQKESNFERCSELLALAGTLCSISLALS